MHPNVLLLITLLALAGCGSLAKPVDAKARIAAGTDKCLRYGFELAVADFAAAREASAAGSEDWLRASLGLAIALHHEVPLSADRINRRAAPLYEEVFAKAGRSPLAARAALSRGRIAEERDEQDDPVDVDTACVWYQKVVDGWPGDPIAGEASLRLAECRIQTLVPEQIRAGIAIAEARATAHPAEAWTGSLWQIAGDAWWVGLRDRANSIRCLQRAEAAGLPDRARAWITIWRIATLAEEAGMRAVAVTYFTRLITDYASSGKGWEAQQRLKALGVEPPAIKAPLDLGVTEDAK